jgi:hypothetical protein
MFGGRSRRQAWARRARSNSSKEQMALESDVYSQLVLKLTTASCSFSNVRLNRFHHPQSFCAGTLYHRGIESLFYSHKIA